MLPSSTFSSVSKLLDVAVDVSRVERAAAGEGKSAARSSASIALRHALRGEHAAVVLLEDASAPRPSERDRAHGEDAPSSTRARPSGAWASRILVRKRHALLLARRGRRCGDRSRRPPSACGARTYSPSRCFHHGWCERPTMMWVTPCVRAKSSSAGTGSVACSRRTWRPARGRARCCRSGGAARRRRCGSGASSGVST